MTETLRRAVRFVSPLIYFASFLLVLAGGLWSLDVLVGALGYEWKGTYFDAVVTAAWLLLVGAVLAAINQTFVRLERLSRPTLVDHARRCCVLYLSLAVLTMVVVQDYVASRTETAYRQEVATPTIYTLLIVGYPVLIDALLLLRVRRRNSHLTAGASA